MRKFLSYFSRFKKGRDVQTKPRTMADSELEDLQGQGEKTPERKRFDEKVYEEKKDKVPLPDSSATH